MIREERIGRRRNKQKGRKEKQGKERKRGKEMKKERRGIGKDNKAD